MLVRAPALQPDRQDAAEFINGRASGRLGSRDAPLCLLQQLVCKARNHPVVSLLRKFPSAQRMGFRVAPALADARGLGKMKVRCCGMFSVLRGKLPCPQAKTGVFLAPTKSDSGSSQHACNDTARSWLVDHV